MVKSNVMVCIDEDLAYYFRGPEWRGKFSGLVNEFLRSYRDAQETNEEVDELASQKEQLENQLEEIRKKIHDLNAKIIVGKQREREKREKEKLDIDRKFESITSDQLADLI